jgi:histidine phosphotransferase ChpT
LNTGLAALIGSRICHDLISPIGAINNGLELLTMSGGPSGPEIGLIGESVGNASARIRFFRVAFGAAGDQMVGPGEVRSILRDLYDAGRLRVEWKVDTPAQRAEVRLSFLAILCAETAMPFGGQVTIARHDKRWKLTGVADRIMADDKMWGLLSCAPKAAEIQPSQVQFALLPLVAEEARRKVSHKLDDKAVEIGF